MKIKGLTLTSSQTYLSNRVTLMVADCYAAVFTAQSQEVLRAPTATCDFLSVLTYTYKCIMLFT